MSKMQNLTIGTTVVVSAYSVMEYANSNEKIIQNYRCIPFLAVICGKAVRKTGFYDPGSSYEYDGDGPSFTASETITFWTVRKGYANKEILVLDENLTVYNGRFELPRLGPKPIVLEESKLGKGIVKSKLKKLKDIAIKFPTGEYTLS